MRAKNHDDLVRFYRTADLKDANLFQVWESGGSRGDSVTPSTYSAEYRSWMVAKLAGELTRNGGGLLSLGCGNAAVEADVLRAGHQVLGLDAMPEAVELAREKGLQAVTADVCQWSPPRTWAVAYADGLLGHLQDPVQGLVPVLSRVRTWVAPRPDSASGVATLVISNDAPNDGSEVQKAPTVDGFHWLSSEFIKREAERAGFAPVVTDEFRYDRPLSGERVRSIVLAYVTD